jgi:hypothetical protein
MAMTLYFKRAKSFVAVVDGGTRKFLAQPGPTPVHNVPDWVAFTPTFEHGIKDQSIVNLTPPHLMPGYKAPVGAHTEPVAESAAEAAIDKASDGPEAVDEQQEVPQAPFGGQPMTPVPPAAKVGLRGGRGK